MIGSQPKGLETETLSIQMKHATSGTKDSVTLETIATDSINVSGVEENIPIMHVMHVMDPISGLTSHQLVTPQSLQINLTNVLPHLFTTISPLHRPTWAKFMELHPNRQFAEDIMTFIDYGVPIYFSGPNLDQVFKNWNYGKKYSKAVSEILCLK